MHVFGKAAVHIYDRRVRQVYAKMKKSKKEELVEECHTDEDEFRLICKIEKTVEKKRKPMFDTMARILNVGINTDQVFPGRRFHDALGKLLQWAYDNKTRYYKGFENSGLVFQGKCIGSGSHKATITVDHDKSLTIHWVKHDGYQYTVGLDAAIPSGTCLDVINWAKNHLRTMELLETVVIRFSDFFRDLENKEARERANRVKEAKLMLKELEDYGRH